jgi:EmrB/QacA subfamily drug resistance transporter
MSEAVGTVGPSADRLDPAVWRICAVALFGALLAQIDATIVNVSLAGLAAELHAPLATIQWVTSGYLLALTLVLPLNGWLVRRIGARQLYLWCFSSFAVSSALCGLAGSAGTLIAFRAVQGISGGLLAPMAQMMVARAAGRHMARVAAYVSLPVLLAPIAGPVLAGVILQHATWRWLFLVNVPVGALALVLAWLFLPADADEAAPVPLDWAGLAALSPGLVLFLYGSERLQAPGGLAMAAAGALLIALFLVLARRKGPAALVDLALFRNAVFGACALAQFLANGAIFAGQMLIPVFLVRACGRSAADMGWMLAPQGLGVMITFLLMGRLVARFGVRRLACAGAGLAMAATLPLVGMALWGFHPALLVVVLFLRGLGQGAVGLPTMSAAYASVDRRDLPMATTSLNIVQRLGGPMLTTLAATVLAAGLGSGGHDAPAAYVWPFVLLCALHGANALAAWRLPLRIGT